MLLYCYSKKGRWLDALFLFIYCFATPILGTIDRFNNYHFIDDFFFLLDSQKSPIYNLLKYLSQVGRYDKSAPLNAYFENANNNRRSILIIPKVLLIMPKLLLILLITLTLHTAKAHFCCIFYFC